MSTAPVPRATQPSRRRTVVIAVVVALALLAAIAAWFGWKHWQAAQASADQKARLQAALDRGRTLTAELAAIKPPDAPACPPGQSLKTYSPDALMPRSAAPSASGPSSAAPAASGARAGNAPVLPDYALAQRLENATAMVLVEHGKDLGSGSGFFITSNLFVTNRHVVEFPNSRILLVSKALGKVRRATLLQLTQGTQTGAADFALLRMDDGTAPSTLDIAREVGKLSPVVASGYPGMVIKSDANFTRLMQGDSSVAPDLSLTQGAVQSKQVNPAGMPVLVHTASINQGNSGGPLVDACGRVVGVNTYIQIDQAQSSKINYALRTDSMSEFLTAAGAGTSAKIDARDCGARP